MIIDIFVAVVSVDVLTVILIVLLTVVLTVIDIGLICQHRAALADRR